MSYTVNGRVATQNPLMDDIVYYTKIILEGIVLKNGEAADNNETEDSVTQSDYYIAIKNGTMRLNYYESVDLYKYLIAYGYSEQDALEYSKDPSLIPLTEVESVLEFCNNTFVDNYVEQNNYYRMLNGYPIYGTDSYNIYIDYDKYSSFFPEGSAIDINFTIPIHEYTPAQLSYIEAIGLLDELKREYITNNTDGTAKMYRYLNFLGTGKRIDIYDARVANNFDILYIPSTNKLVSDRFKELFLINRDIYEKDVYQLAYREGSDYYTQTVMFMILCQTFNDIIVDTPEWFIRRDVIDIKSVQFFLESQGIEYFPDIPLRYQIKIVKNMNKLIAYKSTVRNLDDILEIFSRDDTIIYQYYILKTPNARGNDNIEFLKVPIHEQYDNYIKDSNYRKDYDELAAYDEYWNGEDSEAYVKEKHLEKDFTIEGTKFMGFEYNVDIAEYNKELPYYLGLILTEATDTSRISIDVPSIKQGVSFPIRDLFVFLLCCNGLFTGEELKVRTPDEIITERDKPKPDFEPYIDIDGGNVWSGDGTEDQPVVPEWEVPDLDFGDTENDDPYYNQYVKMYDFGNNYQIDPSEFLRVYDYGDDADLLNAPISLLGEALMASGDPVDDVVTVTEDNCTNFIGQFQVNTVTGDTTLITVDNCRSFIGQTISIQWNWHNIDDHGYISDFNNLTGRVQEYYRHYRMINGGKPGPLDIQSNYYDYIRTDHKNIYIDALGRILGFNVSADLDKLADDLWFRHSAFGFERGYTLEDLGVEGFITKTVYDSYQDLYTVYDNNIKIYDHLVELYDNAGTRDEKMVIKFVIDYLFTLPFQTASNTFYILPSGEIATYYYQILEKYNPILYAKYIEIKSEPDKETRLFNLRNILNDIVDSLSYYINPDQLKYVLSFVYTNSLDSVTHYITELITFFKSWKVQFIDSRINYIIDDSYNNSIGFGDQIGEFKDKLWSTDSNRLTDSLNVTPHYYIEDGIKDSKNMEAEVVDLASHFINDSLIGDFDGGEITKIYSNRLRSSSISDLDENADLDGGNVIDFGKVAYYNIDGGNIPARRNLYDLDGGFANDFSLGTTYLNIDGGKATDYNPNETPDDYYQSDGGPINLYHVRTKSAQTNIDRYNYLGTDVLLSKLHGNYNGIEAVSDVPNNKAVDADFDDQTVMQILDFGDNIIIDPSEDVDIFDYGDQNVGLTVSRRKYVSKAEVEAANNDAVDFGTSRIATLEEIYYELTRFAHYFDNNSAGLNNLIDHRISEILDKPNKVIEKLSDTDYDSKIKNDADTKVQDLRDWFWSINPY